MVKESLDNYLENLSEEDPKRFSTIAIKERPDLFETKVLRIKRGWGNKKTEREVLVASRDPGSGGSLLPVIEELQKDSGIVAITDGWAEDKIKKSFKTRDITPKGRKSFVMSGITEIHPDVILMDASEEQGIDFHVDEALPDVPKVLVEDYYGSSDKFLRTAIERGLPLPEKICVMDVGAREILIKKFPALESRVEVTGQPSFDRFAEEDTENIAKKAKKKLKLKQDDKLIVFMSTIDGIEKATEIADALKKSGENFYFVFRRHPRDNTNYADYKKVFEDVGIRVVDTEGIFTTDEIGAAADVLLTTWSTVGLDAIYRRKPTVNIVDRKFPVPDGYDFPLVPVKLGASIGVDEIGQLSDVLPKLLDGKSQLNAQLFKNMERYYLADGKNAKRVADVVRSLKKNDKG